MLLLGASQLVDSYSHYCSTVAKSDWIIASFVQYIDIMKSFILEWMKLSLEAWSKTTTLNYFVWWGCQRGTYRSASLDRWVPRPVDLINSCGKWMERAFVDHLLRQWKSRLSVETILNRKLTWNLEWIYNNFSKWPDLKNKQLPDLSTSLPILLRQFLHRTILASRNNFNHRVIA